MTKKLYCPVCGKDLYITCETKGNEIVSQDTTQVSLEVWCKRCRREVKIKC